MEKILSFITGGTGGLLKGVEGIISKFKGDPTKLAEMEAELQKAVLDHETKLKALAQQELESYQRDRADARAREVGLRNTIGVWVQNISAAMAILAFIVLIFVSYFYKGDGDKTILNIMLGSLGTIVTGIFGYWFGSSQGSANKERQIQDILKQK